MANAHIIEGLFKTEGIDTHLSYEIACIFCATTLDGIGKVKFLVQE